MMEVLNVQSAKEMLLKVADAIIASKDLLTKIDGAIGDGDHGIGMEGGMKKASAKLANFDAGDNVYKVFETFGKTMMMTMGGASGIIFGSVFMAGAKGAAPKAELTAADFAAMFEGSLAEVKRRGGAAQGDKTMVDAFEPAVETLLASSGEGFSAMLSKAAAAAAEGAEKTKDYVAKFGRAKSLMERAIGHMDAGAVSTSIIFKTMAEYVG